MSTEGVRKPEPLTERVKVQFTVPQVTALGARADELGLTIAGYIRSLVMTDLERAGLSGNPNKKARKHSAMLQVAELHALAMQVKKLGTNVNQLARQSNTAMVPLTRTEIVYMLNQHQLLMSNAIAAVEKMLA